MGGVGGAASQGRLPGAGAAAIEALPAGWYGADLIVDAPRGALIVARCPRAQNRRPAVFLRHRDHEAGRTAAYTCLGAADYVSDILLTGDGAWLPG